MGKYIGVVFIVLAIAIGYSQCDSTKSENPLAPKKAKQNQIDASELDDNGEVQGYDSDQAFGERERGRSGRRIEPKYDEEESSYGEDEYEDGSTSTNSNFKPENQPYDVGGAESPPPPEIPDPGNSGGYDNSNSNDNNYENYNSDNNSDSNNDEYNDYNAVPEDPPDNYDYGGDGEGYADDY